MTSPRTLALAAGAALVALLTVLALSPVHAAQTIQTTQAARTIQATQATPAARTADAGRILHADPLERRRNYWGAISISSDHTFAYALDRGSKKRAIADAYKKCKRNADYPEYCRKATWFANTCAAISYTTYDSGFIHKYRTGFGRTRPLAIKRAHKHLAGKDKILGYACTTRYR